MKGPLDKIMAYLYLAWAIVTMPIWATQSFIDGVKKGFKISRDRRRRGKQRMR